MRLVRLGLAAAAVTATFAVPASADPGLPYPPPPIQVGQCTVHWYPVPIFSDDVPFTPYVPRCIW